MHFLKLDFDEDDDDDDDDDDEDDMPKKSSIKPPAFVKQVNLRKKTFFTKSF